MLSQHRPGAVLQAPAEALPFRDNSFGAAMGVLTVHLWSDRARGLAEMRRVSRGPVVLFVRDGDAAGWWWLYHYFPATARLERNRETRVGDLAAMLGGRARGDPGADPGRLHGRVQRGVLAPPRRLPGPGDLEIHVGAGADPGPGPRGWHPPPRR